MFQSVVCIGNHKVILNNFGKPITQISSTTASTTTTPKPISPEPINCQWSDWSASGSCSKSCNGGSQKFRRFKTVVERNGGSCSGSRETYKSCNTQPCTSKFFSLYKNAVGKWQW